MILKSVPIPLSYGVVITDDTGRVQRFVEKPDWSGVFSDQINTGIYILEKEVLDLIPEDSAYDFGKDLFPRMVREGMAVYGYLMSGYWCDIGDQGAYLQAQLDLLRGEADFDVPGCASGHAILDGACTLEPNVKLEGLCYIGDGALIKQGAVLSEGAVIGPGTIVEEGAHIAKSCLWEYSKVGRCARIEGAVLCRNAQVRPGAQMMEGSALGAEAVLGSHARLNCGAKVWPQKEVGSEVIASENIVWGDLKRLHLNENGAITLDSPARADQLVAAAILGLQATSVALCYRGDGESLYTLLAGSFAARGAQTLLLGSGHAPILTTAMRIMQLSLGVMVDGQKVTILCHNGLMLKKSQIQAIESSALKQEYPPAFAQTSSITALSGIKELYLVNLIKGVNQKVFEKSGLHIAVFCDDDDLLSLALRALKKAGLKKVRGQSAKDRVLQAWETGFLLEPDGTSSFVMDKTVLPDETSQQMLVWHLAAMEGSLPLFASAETPRAVEDLGPVRWKQDFSALDKNEQLAYLRQYDLMHDGILRMLALLHPLADRSLQSLMDQLPKTHRVRKDVPCPTGEKGRVLRLLCENAKQKELGEGLLIRHGSGSVWLSPFQDRDAFRVQTESFDAEFAGELCTHYADRITKMTEKQLKKDENDMVPDAQ